MPPSSTRPTIEIDGQHSQALADALVQLSVVENIAGLCRCEAVFNNWGPAAGPPQYLFFDRQLLDFGVAFRVRSDPSGGMLFDGRIIAIEAGFPKGSTPTIQVRAEDRLHDLRITRRTRTFEDVSDVDVMIRIANDHGLTPDIQVTGPQHKILAQLNQSDLAFLLDRARSIDAELWVDGARLYAKSRAARPHDTVSLSYGVGLREFSVMADLTKQRTRVGVAGWDPDDKSAIEFGATDRVLSGELNGRASGPGLLMAAFGAREESVVHTAPRSSDEAQFQAEAHFKALAREFVVGRGIASAEPRIRAGALVNLSELGPLFSGRYYVTESRQVFDGQSGMRTEFTAETAGLGGA